jgi:transposase
VTRRSKGASGVARRARRGWLWLFVSLAKRRGVGPFTVFPHLPGNHGVRRTAAGEATWGIQGQTPVVRSTGQRSSVNMISAVSARGHMRFMLAKGRVNGAVFVESLKRLMHNAAQPIFLILDSGSYHHSRLVKDYVARLNGKLRLFFLPPYSPELNPDEQVWNYVKHHGVAKTGLRTGKELRKYVLARLRSLQRLPWTIRMFFLTPDTQYAAT